MISLSRTDTSKSLQEFFFSVKLELHLFMERIMGGGGGGGALRILY